MNNTPRFTPFPVLSTPRFTLRQLSLADEHEIFILRTDADVNRHLDRQLANSIEDARRFIQTITDNITKDLAILWAIEPRDGGPLVGTICLWNICREDASAEIGYELLPQHQGQGVMQEVLPAVIEYGFNGMDLCTITAEMTAGNIRSAKLLERHGFVRGDVVDGMVSYTLKFNK